MGEFKADKFHCLDEDDFAGHHQNLLSYDRVEIKDCKFTHDFKSQYIPKFCLTIDSIIGKKVRDILNEITEISIEFNPSVASGNPTFFLKIPFVYDMLYFMKLITKKKNQTVIKLSDAFFDPTNPLLANLTDTDITLHIKSNKVIPIVLYVSRMSFDLEAVYDNVPEKKYAEHYDKYKEITAIFGEYPAYLTSYTQKVKNIVHHTYDFKESDIVIKDFKYNQNNPMLVILESDNLYSVTEVKIFNNNVFSFPTISKDKSAYLYPYDYKHVPNNFIKIGDRQKYLYQITDIIKVKDLAGIIVDYIDVVETTNGVHRFAITPDKVIETVPKRKERDRFEVCIRQNKKFTGKVHIIVIEETKISYRPYVAAEDEDVYYCFCDGGPSYHDKRDLPYIAQKTSYRYGNGRPFPGVKYIYYGLKGTTVLNEK
jgi:hypothetical protein